MKPGRKLVEQGASACTDAEIMAIIIGSGGAGYSALDCAQDLLSRFPKLSMLMNQPLSELAKTRGVKSARTIRIAAAYELAARLVKELQQNA
jgi:DNA repair protein RadC